jgi:hypothetical protein
MDHAKSDCVAGMGLTFAMAIKSLKLKGAAEISPVSN